IDTPLDHAAQGPERAGKPAPDPAQRTRHNRRARPGQPARPDIFVAEISGAMPVSTRRESNRAGYRSGRFRPPNICKWKAPLIHSSASCILSGYCTRKTTARLAEIREHNEPTWRVLGW